MFLLKHNCRLRGLLNPSICPRLVDSFPIFDISIAALSLPTRRRSRSRSNPSAPFSTSCPMIGSRVRWSGSSRHRPLPRLPTWPRRVRFQNSVSLVSLVEMTVKSTDRRRRVRKRVRVPMRWEAVPMRQRRQQKRRMPLLRPWRGPTRLPRVLKPLRLPNLPDPRPRHR